MIASWVSQISYDPPLITVAVHPNRYCHHLVRQSGCFALHSLARSQMDLLSHFKGPDPEAKFAAVQWESGTTGCPILNNLHPFM
jgi:flavin reductase (DIM6/NTAB) family NADH-FMN oxidoreductase RutF